MPSRASLSMFGVRMSLVPKAEYSARPRSSARMTRMLGFDAWAGTGVGAAREPGEVPRRKAAINRMGRDDRCMGGRGKGVGKRRENGAWGGVFTVMAPRHLRPQS